MMLTCEGNPWISITGGLSALPLSTQNHLSCKIILTERGSIGIQENNTISHFYLQTPTN